MVNYCFLKVCINIYSFFSLSLQCILPLSKYFNVVVAFSYLLHFYIHFVYGMALIQFLLISYHCQKRNIRGNVHMRRKPKFITIGSPIQPKNKLSGRKHEGYSHEHNRSALGWFNFLSYVDFQLLLKLDSFVSLDVTSNYSWLHDVVIEHLK